MYHSKIWHEGSLWQDCSTCQKNSEISTDAIDNNVSRSNLSIFIKKHPTFSSLWMKLCKMSFLNPLIWVVAMATWKGLSSSLIMQLVTYLSIKKLQSPYFCDVMETRHNWPGLGGWGYGPRAEIPDPNFIFPKKLSQTTWFLLQMALITRSKWVKMYTVEHSCRLKKLPFSLPNRAMYDVKTSQVYRWMQNIYQFLTKWDTFIFSYPIVSSSVHSHGIDDSFLNMLSVNIWKSALL